MRAKRPITAREATGLTLAALAVAALCWYLGTDVWHAILLGVAAITLGGIGVTVGNLELGRREAQDDASASRRRGSRTELAELAWALRGGGVHVSYSALSRVRRLARRRLARRGLELLDPACRPQVEPLIGRRAYRLLGPVEHRPPTLRSLSRCLDALDTLRRTEGTPRG